MRSTYVGVLRSHPQDQLGSTNIKQAMTFDHITHVPHYVRYVGIPIEHSGNVNLR